MTFANIYCVGRNFTDHAKELHNAVPEQPLIFMKPTHAAVELDNRVLPLPADQGTVHYETELVLHIGKDYAPGIPLDELVDSFTVGIDFTLRGIQTVLKKRGYPWLAAKGFRQSAALGRFLPFPGLNACRSKDFSLQINQEERQRGNINEMIFDPVKLITFCANRYGIGSGDLLFTGTPAGVGPVTDGDQLTVFWGDEALGRCIIRL